MNKKIISAGHICLDITPVFSEARGGSIGEILVPGSTLQCGQADIHTGGSVANTGLAFRFFGADVQLMGKTGNDEFGGMIRTILEGHGADTSHMLTGEGATAYTVILAFPGIDRVFMHHSGANDTFCEADVPDESLEGAALFHFGYPPHMARMYKDGGRELTALMKRVHEKGVAVSMDLAGVDEHAESGSADWDGILARTLPYVDFFVPSAEEVCYMLDRDRYRDWRKRAAGGAVTDILEPERDVRPLADKCVAYGARVVLIKCGKKGMYYKTASREAVTPLAERLGLSADSWADAEGFQKSFKPDRVRSETGAGDVSIAAFLVSALEGGTPGESAALAAGAGASCVEGYDALSTLRPLDELREKINSGWTEQD